jgi:hypothetical protein
VEGLIFWATLAAIIGGTGTVLRVFFSDRAKAKRAIKRAKRKNIADVQDGEIVKIRGTLRYAGSTVVAPISGRQCVAFNVMVEQSQGKRTPIRFTEDDCTTFLLEDATGKALVSPTLARLVVSTDAHRRSGVFEDPTPQMITLLDDHGVDYKGIFLNNETRYVEGILEEGETVAVLGLAHWEPDPDPGTAARGGYRERATRLRITDPPEGETIVSDEPSVLD